MKLLLVLLPTISLVVYGQLVIKWRVGALSGALPAASGVSKLWNYLTDPFIVSAYFAALISSITWMYVVDRYPLSQAFPVHIGLTVLMVVLGGIFLFDEQITASRICAVLLIVAGVAVATRS